SLGLSGGQDSYYGLQRPIGEQQLVAPSEMFAIADSRTIAVSHIAPTFPDAFEGSGVDWATPTLLGSGTELLYWKNPERHGKNYNVVYCDAHVAGIARLNLFDLNRTALNWNNDHQLHREVW